MTTPQQNSGTKYALTARKDRRQGAILMQTWTLNGFVGAKEKEAGGESQRDLLVAMTSDGFLTIFTGCCL